MSFLIFICPTVYILPIGPVIPRPYNYLGLILYHLDHLKIEKAVYYHFSGTLECLMPDLQIQISGLLYMLRHTVVQIPGSKCSLSGTTLGKEERHRYDAMLEMTANTTPRNAEL